MGIAVIHTCPMARRPGRQFRRLYIGEWIVRLGRQQREIALAVGIGESYMSLLAAGTKKNPSGQLLFDISEILGVAVNDLYRPPPAAAALEAAESLSPQQIATLGRLLDTMNKFPKK